MFFPFIAFSVVAAAFIQLGELSAWVSVLSLTIKAMLLAAIAVALYFTFRRFAL
jgi:hypothetical protein